MSTLPDITSVQVATVPLPAYLARLAAIQAAAGSSSPLPEVNFTLGTVMLGDGNGSTPPISTLQSTGALVHQVWSGQIVQSVSVDPVNPNQVDILAVVPAVDGSGAEIGPFWVTEFIITDENGVPMIAGVTLMPKLVTANGSAVDLSFIGAVAYSAGTVVLAAPSATYLTTAAAQSAISALLTANLPLSVASSLQSNGWTKWLVSVANAISTAVGVGRPATDAEFAAGAAAAAPAYQWPWPTLQQIAAKFLSIQSKCLHVQKQRAVSTTPPALTSSFANWLLNTVALNEITGASLDVMTGQITLPAGEYVVDFLGMATASGRHDCQLLNVSTNAVVASGCTSDSYAGGGASSSTTASFGKAKLTLTATTVLALQHRDRSTHPGRMGDATTDGGGVDFDANVFIETRW